MNNVPGGLYIRRTMQNAATATGNGTPLTVTDDLTGSMSIAVFQITGISGDTITFEVQINGSDWVGILTENVTTGAEATTATANGIYRCTVAGLTQIRTRLTRVGGTVTVIGVVLS